MNSIVIIVLGLQIQYTHMNNNIVVILNLLYIGLQIQCSSSEFIVGESVECSCSSDLDPISIEWYQGNTSLQQRSDNTGTNITIPVTTDSEGSVYTCLVESSCGTQQKTVTLNTTGV